MSVTAVPGFLAAGAACGVKASGADDLAMVATADGSPVTAAGVFTSNKMTAPPVLVTREHLAATGGRAAAVVLNSGNANAATGAAGMADAELMCTLTAEALGCSPDEVLVCSTGLIGFPLPMDRIIPAIPLLAGALTVDGGPAAARAIMTTDTVPRTTITTGTTLDGDTFTTTDGRTIRLLGVDSCEVGTYGGDAAKSITESQLSNQYNQPVVLVQAPGVDTDGQGRHLRYVKLGDEQIDLGLFLVPYDYTGVAQGKNPAPQSYIDQLYGKDLDLAANPPAGRDCGGPTTSGGSSDVDVYVDTDGGNYNMPDGALTGGYCARKWWC